MAGRSDVSNSIALRLRELRRRIGFSRRADMASHLGLPNSTYSAYEGDAGPPKVEWLVELARRGVNLNWLLTGDGEMFLPPHAVAPALPADPVLTPSPADGGPPPPSPPRPARPREPEVDAYLLAAMIRRVEREERERGRSLSALEKGEMVARLYAASARLTEAELATHPLGRAAEAPER